MPVNMRLFPQPKTRVADRPGGHSGVSILKIFLFAAVALCFAGDAAEAQTASVKCRLALNDGSFEELRQYADEIIEDPESAIANEIQIPFALDCLKAVTGDDYVYLKDLGPVLPSNPRLTEFKRIREERIQRERVAEEERRRQRKLAAEQRRQRAAEAELAKQARKLAVVRQLIESCNHLYKRSPHETITNKLCFEVFSENGLPE